MGERAFRKLTAVVLLWLVSILASSDVLGKSEYTIGGDKHQWAKSGTLYYINTTGDTGSIQPLKADPTENLSLKIRAREGDIIYGGRGWWGWKPPKEVTDLMIDGDEGTALVHEPEQAMYHSGYETIPLDFDLGAQFPVNRVRFYPREEFQHHIMSRYRLYVNDGRPENLRRDGTPIYKLIRDETENLTSVVDLRIPLQLVRFIQLIPLSIDRTWEVAEFEVYGEGYVPHASYTSNIIDFDDIANWGRIRWRGRKDPEARVLIQTRSGSDEDPDVYWRKTGVGDEEVSKAESGEPLTEEDYNALSREQRGGITHDMDNWSFWSTYPFEAGLEGVSIVSPSPRRYFQVKVDFIPTSTDGGEIDFITFEFSKRLAAWEVVAEISPTEVPPAEVTTFTYALRPRIRGDDTGFDSLEITTPVVADAVRSVRIDGQDVAFTAEFLDNPTRFVVHFPRIKRDQTLLEVVFDCPVLRYGTGFDGRVFDSRLDEVPQLVKAGNVTDKLVGSSLSVKTILGGSLIASVDVSPNPFTPNGDGINDMLSISYVLLKLTSPADVSVDIYDLSGAFVRRVYSGEDSSGLYSWDWDGANDDDQVVPPGVYLYQISVDGDGGRENRTGTITVVY